MKPATRLTSIFRGAFLLAMLLQLAGCYYAQAIRGHNDLMNRRRPVIDVIHDSASPDDLRQRLELVLEARDFSVSELLLADNDSYRSYADLDRDYVVWNVFAAPEFALDPKTWCYPVAGCVAYRGYFREATARKLADKLSGQGFDVAVGGVAAYSTLGRFADPLLNTMMHWSDVELVSTMFHELAHQKLYIKGDSTFNESFASAVAEIGVSRWLATKGESGRLAVRKRQIELRKEMMGLVAPARQELAHLYATAVDEQTMREEKTAILDQLSANAQALIDAGDIAVGNWLAAPLNNARLVSLNLYEGRLDVFRTIAENCAGELNCFYAQAEALADLPEYERAARMNKIADQLRPGSE